MNLQEFLKYDAENPRSNTILFIRNFGSKREHWDGPHKKNYPINLGFTFSNGTVGQQYHFTDRRDLRRQAIREYADYISEYFVDFDGWNKNQIQCGGFPHRTQRDAIRTIEQDYINSILLEHFPSKQPV